MGKKLDALIADLQGQMWAGESILAACLGQYDTTWVGQQTIRQGALVATSQRVILHGKHWTTTNTETYPYDRIGSIESGKTMVLGSWVTLNTPEHNMRMKMINDGHPEAVVGHIRQHISAPRTAPAPPGPAQAAPGLDVASQIAQLTALLNQGVLSRPQYDAAVAKVVSP